MSERVAQEKTGHIAPEPPPRGLAWVPHMLKVSRPGFYITTVWFYVLPLGGTAHFHQWRFWLGLFYVCMPLGALMYGANDAMDTETDALNARKGSWLFGARLTAATRWPTLWAALGLQVPFLALFVWADGWRMVLWFVAMLLANALYNASRWGFKNWPGLDLANQVAYLLIFVLSSWLNRVPQLPWDTMAFSALFAMHAHWFGQIMDVDADRAAGRHTTCVTIGVGLSKLGVVALLAVETWLMASRDPIVAFFTAAGGLVFLADRVVGFKDRAYPPWAAAALFMAWNATALVSANWLWARGTLAQ